MALAVLDTIHEDVPTNPKRMVVKRDGTFRVFDGSRIRVRLQNLVEVMPNNPDPSLDCKLEGVDLDKVISQTEIKFTNNITTVDIDSLLADTAASLVAVHPNYGKLGGRILATNMQRQINIPFSANCERLMGNINKINNKPEPILAENFIQFVRTHAKDLDDMIRHGRDRRFDHFGIRTVMQSYLLSMNSDIAELPQFLYMRVAVALSLKYENPLPRIRRIYDLLSYGKVTFGTPTFCSAGCAGSSNLSSCFLKKMIDDSMTGIMTTLHDLAMTSKSGGGNGLAISNIRAKGTPISGGGIAKGIKPILMLLARTLWYADQRGKRPGSCAVYIEPWHADTPEILELYRNTNREYNDVRLGNVFIALWMPDLFFKRLQEDGMWSLMCPKSSPGLMDLWGPEFEAKYLEYESKGMFVRQMPAKELFNMIYHSNVETGNPFLLSKDRANLCNNQKHLGILYCSNLCTEIFEYCNNKETAVCNLATMSLPSYVGIDMETGAPKFDSKQYVQDVMDVVVYLNDVIDCTTYPLEQMRISNMQHRPVGLGVQGLADNFAMFKMPYGSPDSLKLITQIMELHYFAALTASNRLAQQYGPFPSYGSGSPASHGRLHFDHWNVTLNGMIDWQSLRHAIAKYGLRNSLLVAMPPTATTSNSLGNNEGCEPFTRMIYARETLSGSHTIINKHLVRDLEMLGLWTDEIRSQIMRDRGSIQKISDIPGYLKDVYLTATELDPFMVIDVAAAIQPFTDQGISLNWYLDSKNVTPELFLMMMNHAHASGLKTLKYYLHSTTAKDRKDMTTNITTTAPKIPEQTAAKDSQTHSQDVGEDDMQQTAAATEPEPEIFVCKREAGCTSCSA